MHCYDSAASAGSFKQSANLSAASTPRPHTALSQKSSQHARSAAQSPGTSKQHTQHALQLSRAAPTSRLSAANMPVISDQRSQLDSGATLASQEPSDLHSPDGSSHSILGDTAVQDQSPGHELNLPQPSFQLEQAQSPVWHSQQPSDNQSGMNRASTVGESQHTVQKLLHQRHGSQTVTRHAQQSRSAAKMRGSGLQWQPMQASVESPDKQELGRRKLCHLWQPCFVGCICSHAKLAPACMLAPTGGPSTTTDLQKSRLMTHHKRVQGVARACRLWAWVICTFQT